MLFQARGTKYYLRYIGDIRVSFFTASQLLEVALVRTNRTPVLTDHYLSDMLSSLGVPLHMEHFVSIGHQIFPLTGNAKLEPCDIIGVGSAPMLQVSLNAYETAEPPLHSELTTDTSNVFSVNVSRPNTTP